MRYIIISNRDCNVRRRPTKLRSAAERTGAVCHGDLKKGKPPQTAHVKGHLIPKIHSAAFTKPAPLLRRQLSRWPLSGSKVAKQLAPFLGFRSAQAPNDEILSVVYVIRHAPDEQRFIFLLTSKRHYCIRASIPPVQFRLHIKSIIIFLYMDAFKTKGWHAFHIILMSFFPYSASLRS